VAKLQQQIENELKMLAKLDLTTLPGMTRAAQRVEQVLRDSGEYESAAGELDARYPLDFSHAPRDVIEQLQPGWNQTYRSALVESRGVQNQIYADLDAAAQRVAALVEASNSAEGVTAAVQAHNELLAASSTELSKLQALKLSRARLKAERLAREQSDLAYRRARREAVMRDADDPGASGPIPMPFGN
jgi:P-type conjugative transfer protein TrbJ